MIKIIIISLMLSISGKMYPIADSNTVILILPGGGYKHVSANGSLYAEWLNDIGIPAYVLDYRPNPYPFPMQDACAALKELRKEYKTIGVLGESAGGHLAASINIYDPNSKPDFLILLFPAITMTKSFQRINYWKNIFRENADPNLLEKYSVEDNPTLCPTFIVGGNLDASCPPENGIAYYLSLRKRNIKAELHIFYDAQHGFYENRKYNSLGIWNKSDIWPKLCENWINQVCPRKIISRTQ